MTQRAITEKNRAWLSMEMEIWRNQGIISDGHSAKIRDIYISPQESARQRYALARFALFGLAALMVGLAVLLLVGYNWEAIGRSVKLSIIFGAILGIYGAAFGLRYLRKAQVLSEMLFFLGCLFYGAAIWLIAQIFNINSHYPDGVWYWALGVLPFALCLDTLLFHCLYAGLLATWAGFETLGFPHLGHWLFFGWAFPSPAAYCLPLLALPGIVWAYRKGSPLTLAIYLSVVAWWIVLQPLCWQLNSDPMLWVAALGGIFLMIALVHLPRNRMAAPFFILGAGLVLVGLVPLSFAEYQYEYFYHSNAESINLNIYSAICFVVAGLLCVMGLAYGMHKKQIRQNGTPVSFASQLLPLVVPLAIIGSMVFLCVWHGTINVPDRSANYYMDSDLKWTYPILVPVSIANILMVGFAIWLIRLGMKDDRGKIFALGVAYFLLWAMLRYYDLFSDVGGMLGAALLFLVCGLTLYVVARIWQHRKEISHV